MAAPQREPRPSVVPLALALALAVALIPFIPEPYRQWNFAAFGAVGLFAAARGGRYGLAWAALFSLGAKLAFDYLNYVQKGYDPLYRPFDPPVLGIALYAGLAVYPLLGRAFLRRTEHPVPIAGAAVVGGLVFFLVTNFGSWVNQDLPYPQTLGGLLEAYEAGLPFYRGTLVGDLTFTAVLFGLYAVAVRVAPRPAPVLDTADRS